MIGYYDTEPKINSDEVESWKWMSIDAVKQICSCIPRPIPFGLK
jgi:isopentenyldiphosphate isomerase